MKASLTITVRPLAVVNCLALPRVSRKLLASLTWLLGPTPPGTRRTWLARNSSEPVRSAYDEPESLSREVRRTSVVGTRRTCGRGQPVGVVCGPPSGEGDVRGAARASTGWGVHCGRRRAGRGSAREAFNRH